MEINQEEDNLSEKTLSDEMENETQSTMQHPDSSSGSLSYLDGKTEAEFSKVESARKTNNVSDRAHGQGRSCPICAREFSSGKALGGHIRIHKNPKPDDSVAEVVPIMTQVEKKRDNTCFICKKSFPSIMSLCDHITSHAEMDLKGIRPPNSVETASEPDSNQLKQQEPDKDLVNDMSNWLVTEKRGRNATTNEKLGLDRVPEKERTQAWNQTRFPRKDLNTEKAAAILLKGEEILEKDLPEEGEIIEQELNTRKADSDSIRWGLVTDSFSTFRALGGQRISHGMINNIVHQVELPLFCAAIDDKRKREARPGSMVVKSHKTQRQYPNCDKTFQTCQSLSNHENYLQKETADDPFGSITLQEEAKEIDFKGESAGEDSRGFDHRVSISPEAKQAGTRNVLDFDLNLAYEE